VAVGLGTCLRNWGPRTRLSLAFGAGQFIMPLVGWSAGALILPYVAAYDHWVAFGVLTAISARMMWESFHAEPALDQGTNDPTLSWVLAGLAVAVSIDALAVGFTMSAWDGRQIIYASIIGVTAAIMTLGGTIVGCTATRRWGVWAERAGALLLFGVALKMLAI